MAKYVSSLPSYVVEPPPPYHTSTDIVITDTLPSQHNGIDTSRELSSLTDSYRIPSPPPYRKSTDIIITDAPPSHDNVNDSSRISSASTDNRKPSEVQRQDAVVKFKHDNDVDSDGDDGIDNLAFTSDVVDHIEEGSHGNHNGAYTGHMNTYDINNHKTMRQNALMIFWIAILIFSVALIIIGVRHHHCLIDTSDNVHKYYWYSGYLGGFGGFASLHSILRLRHFYFYGVEPEENVACYGIFHKSIVTWFLVPYGALKILGSIIFYNPPVIGGVCSLPFWLESVTWAIIAITSVIKYCLNYCC